MLFRSIQAISNSTSITSSVTAASSTAVKSLQDQINALSVSSNITFAGTINGSTGRMATVTTEGAGVGFTVGSVLPTPSATIAEYFVIVSTSGTMTPPGGSATAVNIGDWWLASNTAWTYIEAGYTPNYASTSTAGIVQIGTNINVAGNGLISVASGSTSAAGVLQLTDSTSSTSTTTAATPNSVKSAYDLADTANTTANAALPKAGGTMTGNITFQDTNEGLVFNGGSTIYAISDAVNATSSTTAASSTAVKSAYTLANAALPKTGGDMTGNIVFQDTNEGVV